MTSTWGVAMVVGVLLLGMIAGGIAAGTWLAGGGSILVAFFLYALVGSLAVLGSSALSFAVAELRRTRVDAPAPGLRHVD